MRAKQIELPVSPRMEVGKGAAKRLRESGHIPAVIYGRGMQSQPLSVDAAAFARAITEGVWFSTVIKLHISAGAPAATPSRPPEAGKLPAAPREGAKKADRDPTVMITEVQRDLARGRILSIDFHRISLRETVRAHVPVVPIGQSSGVRLGGILEQILHEVEVECLPTNLPDHLEVDVAPLGIGDVVRVKDLAPPPGVRLLAPEDETVLLVAPPVRIEEAPAAAPVEGAVIAETEEPEVLRQREAEE